MTNGAIRDAADREKPPLSQAELMKRRNRMAIWLVLGMLCMSLVLVILGIYTTTRTESLSITGYASGVILAFGSFLGVLGLCLEENRKQLVHNTTSHSFVTFVLSFLLNGLSLFPCLSHYVLA
uniref:Uncharacterized protein n=1 Tax=Hucho hucho TaxID=62062 RepID=A0A4W5JVL3_9TELE